MGGGEVAECSVPVEEYMVNPDCGLGMRQGTGETSFSDWSGNETGYWGDVL